MCFIHHKNTSLQKRLVKVRSAEAVGEGKMLRILDRFHGFIGELVVKTTKERFTIWYLESSYQA